MVQSVLWVRRSFVYVSVIGGKYLTARTDKPTRQFLITLALTRYPQHLDLTAVSKSSWINVQPTSLWCLRSKRVGVCLFLVCFNISLAVTYQGEPKVGLKEMSLVWILLFWGLQLLLCICRCKRLSGGKENVILHERGDLPYARQPTQFRNGCNEKCVKPDCCCAGNRAL